MPVRAHAAARGDSNLGRAVCRGSFDADAYDCEANADDVMDGVFMRARVAGDEKDERRKRGDGAGDGAYDDDGFEDVDSAYVRGFVAGFCQPTVAPAASPPSSSSSLLPLLPLPKQAATIGAGTVEAEVLRSLSLPACLPSFDVIFVSSLSSWSPRHRHHHHHCHRYHNCLTIIFTTTTIIIITIIIIIIIIITIRWRQGRRAHPRRRRVYGSIPESRLPAPRGSRASQS